MNEAETVETPALDVADVESSPSTPWMAALDRRGDVGLDDIRARAGVGRDDRHLRQRERGEELLLEGGERDAAEDRHDDREQSDQGTVAQAEHR